MTEINENAGFYLPKYEKLEKAPKNYRKRGKYCIEITFFSGDACFVAGFNNTENAFYSLYGRSSNPTNWHNNEFTSMSFAKVNEKSTYAVLLDIRPIHKTKFESRLLALYRDLLHKIAKKFTKSR